MSPHEFDQDPESIPFESISLPPDEAKRAPFSDDLVKLATEGREFRAVFVLGFADIPGLGRVLDENGAGELLACRSTQVRLSSQPPMTKE